MANNIDIAPELLAAYQHTHYKVFSGEQTIVLKVGERNKDLVAMFARFNCLDAAYITPQNPFSKQCTEADNKERLRQFEDRLKELDYKFLKGVGQDPDGIWPGEQSYLIFGIDRVNASKLAEEYGQNAYIYCGPSGVPELVIRPYPELQKR